MNQDRLLQLFISFKRGGKFFIHPHIPQRKISLSRKTMRIPENQPILCIIDNTALGSAKEGVVFTDSAVYAKSVFDPPDTVAYADLPGYEPADTGASHVLLKNSLGRQIRFDLLVTEISPDYFLNLIRSLQSLIQDPEALLPAPEAPLQARAAHAPPAGLPQAHAAAPPYLVEPLTGGLLNALNENVPPSETIHIALNGNPGEALVVTNQRLLIIKAGFSSGALFGQKAKSFLLDHVTSVETSCGLIEGRIQFSTPGTIEASHGWRQLNPLNAAIDASQAENIVTFTRDQKSNFQQAAEFIRSLISQHAQPQPVLHIQQTESIPDILLKLTSLRDRGIVSEQEYQDKKRELLERL